MESGHDLPRASGTGSMSGKRIAGDRRTPGAAGQPLGTIDPFSLVVGAGYREPAGRFGTELSAIYNARKSLEDTAGVCSTECFRPDSFVVLDLFAWFAVTDRIKLRGGIFNLTDETYAYWSDVRGLSAASRVTEAYTRPGRNFSVSASFTF